MKVRFVERSPESKFIMECQLDAIPRKGEAVAFSGSAGAYVHEVMWILYEAGPVVRITVDTA